VAEAVPAAAEGALVAFGVRPTRPETGYGYILAGRGRGVGPVHRFVEKPDAATAAAYVADGRYLWNAGIFLLRADLLLQEMERFRPDILEAAQGALREAGTGEDAILLHPERFSACPSESLDYAVLERTAAAAVMPLDVGWSDVGDFDALWAASTKDDEGNAVTGPAELLNVVNSLVLSDGPVVAAIGVEDLVIAVHDGVVLILPRNRAQDVKRLIERIQTSDRADCL
jgi:mannose-1-phosphate guanylyltransferase/mannose-6-phosphate isomerase